MNGDTQRAPVVLVVDDNPAGRYSTSRVLRSAGFEVLEAETGQEGLDRSPHADLVVLDVNLPDMSGFEVCRRIRNDPRTRRVPVIHLSATFVKDRDKVEGLEAGADGYLTHPVEPPVLTATVKAFLRARRAEEERERLLELERAARAEAELANRLKDDFLATLSHELRTPLNAIVGWADVLRHGSPTEADLKEGLEAIERNARAQSQLISDLLDVSRITSGKLRLDLRPIDLPGTIRESLEALVHSIQSKGIELEQSLGAGVGMVVGDPQRLQQVIWNLVSNAVKFTPPGGKIRVTLANEGGNARITVEDNGRGIKPDFLPHIFERFRQEDATSKRNQGGLGLGLAIVHCLVEMHGGSVTAESEGEGRGARFTVRLPLEGADEANRGGTRRDATEPRSLEPEPLRGVRVLVVEDDEDSRRLLLRTLTRAGAEVSAVSSVRAALVTLPEFRPNVLVSDVGMPDQDGYDLVREARAQGLSARELPAIALTAFARSEDEERSLEAGFQVHLSKPVDQGRLVAALVSVTANRAEPG
jgi:signal transduction histidine kinase